MDTNDQPDPAKASELAQKIVALLMDTDSATRQRAIHAAMMLLGEKPIAEQESTQRSKSPHAAAETSVELAQFFDRGEKLKPSDNAQLCAAYHYAVYGNAAFSLDDIRAIGREAGVVLPNRLDMTLGSAAHGGKKLFQPAGRGNVKPTAAAGVAFQERWNVRPGIKNKTASG